MAYKTLCPECGHAMKWNPSIHKHDEGCCCIANCPNCGVEFRDVYAMEWKRSEYTLPKDKRRNKNET